MVRINLKDSRSLRNFESWIRFQDSVARELMRIQTFNVQEVLERFKKVQESYRLQESKKKKIKSLEIQEFDV